MFELPISVVAIQMQAQRLWNEAHEMHITRGQMTQEIYGLFRQIYGVKSAQAETGRIIKAMDQGIDCLTLNRKKGPMGLINRAARFIIYLTGYSVQLGEMSGPGDHSLDPVAWDYEQDVQDELQVYTSFHALHEYARHPYYHLAALGQSEATLCELAAEPLLRLPTTDETYRPCPKCVAAMNALAKDAMAEAVQFGEPIQEYEDTVGESAESVIPE